jgi:vacuolar-type H+-ATPase subunit I/STV1
MNSPRDAPRPLGEQPKGDAIVSTFLWILCVLAYLTALVVLGMATLRKGHTALFWFGILFPFLWIIGALMGPTRAAAAAEARTSVQ